MPRVRFTAILILGLAIAFFLILFLTSRSTATYTYEIVNAYPHDPQAFTQGLIYDQGLLYEGTGLRGYSSLRRVALTSGKVLQIYRLPPAYFGEGITLWEDKIIQLTWKARRGFVYDVESFKLLGQFRYPTDGWGLTHDGQHLIMSDGSANLYFLNPKTFAREKTLSVRDGQKSITNINELEYINGEVWANIWQTECVARISPQTGQVIAWLDFSGLRDAKLQSNPDAVLNGIAYDAANQRLFITGKLWPRLFEVRVIPANTQSTCASNFAAVSSIPQ